MSVTLNGGVTFGGGLTLSAAPPPSTPTAGWFGGGFTTLSAVDRITFATDTATASARGPLSIGRFGYSATGTLTYGWFVGGGVAPATYPWTVTSSTDRITFATDTATSSTRGPLTFVKFGSGATGDDTTYGWVAGGGDAAVATITTVNRITYANDTATASIRGPLSANRYAFNAAGNPTYGWFASGYTSTAPAGKISSVDRITYATDTDTATSRGPLNTAITWAGATGNDNYGWWGGGLTPAPGGISNIQRIDYATDTATATVRGPLSRATQSASASTDNTYGWWAGGAPGPVSTVDRVTFATDTATATARGPLSSARYWTAATSGIQ